MNAYIEHTTESRGRVVTIAAVEKVTAKKVAVAGFGTYDRETGRPYIGAQRSDEARLLGWEDDSYTTQHITSAGEGYATRPTDDSAFSAWVEKQWFPTTKG